MVWRMSNRGVDVQNIMIENFAIDMGSFELFEEQCLFDVHDFFFYHKFTHDHRQAFTVQSFAEAITRPPSLIIKHLRQSQNDPTTAEAARLVAINVGSSLVSLCFSYTKLSDRIGERNIDYLLIFDKIHLTRHSAVETFAPHLSSIQYLQFDGTNTGSNAIRAVAKFCRNTLRSLRVRECSGITSESCAWMAGAIGHNTPRLRKLKALDVSGTQVDDRGLAFLSKGLHSLQYLDLQDCFRLTDRGVAKIISEKPFCRMKALNFRGTNVGDASVIQMAKEMPQLKHLNLSQCGTITNKSAKAICTLVVLETLSLEGASGVNDVGLGMISSKTKLNLLNITGCGVSRKSLLAVIAALGYVQESTNFFGFLIRNSDAKVSTLRERELESMHRQQNLAARSLQSWMKSKQITIYETRSLQEIERHRAASTLQIHLMNIISRRKHKACE